MPGALGPSSLAQPFSGLAYFLKGTLGRRVGFVPTPGYRAQPLLSLGREVES